MHAVDMLKEKAGRFAVNLIQDGMVLGLGTGSTVWFFLMALAEKIKSGKYRNLCGVSSSDRTAQLARQNGIPLADFTRYQRLDLTVDGADEADRDMNLIKGGGGALLREKILAQASERYVIIIDESKYSHKLGSHWPVPVEVMPYAEPLEQKFLKECGARIKLRQGDDGQPYVTEQNNHILDCDFGPIENLHELSAMLDQRAGIQAHGLFLDFTTDLIIAAHKEVRHLQK